MTAVLRRLGIAAAAGAACFALASIVYAALTPLMPWGSAFGAVYRMHCYHFAHPHQYIALVAVVYAGALLVTPAAVGRWPWWLRAAAILAGMAAVVTIASVPGGVLWKIHDMQAGYVPPPERAAADLIWGAQQGLLVGWLVVALSFPFNAVGIALGFAVTAAALRALSAPGAGSGSARG